MKPNQYALLTALLKKRIMFQRVTLSLKAYFLLYLLKQNIIKTHYTEHVIGHRLYHSLIHNNYFVISNPKYQKEATDFINSNPKCKKLPVILKEYE